MRVKHLILTTAGAIGTLAFSGMPIAPVAAAASAAAAAAADFCPLHVRVYALKNLPDELAFAVWSDDVAGTASGSIVAYVNGGRYTIPFDNAEAPDERDPKAVPAPVVVKFDAPAQFESAYVGALEGGACAIHDPFVGKPLSTVGFIEDTKVKLYPDHSNDWPEFLAQAAAKTPLTAPAPVPEDKLACAVPYAPAQTKFYAPPIPPANVANTFDGDFVVKLALGADGKVTAMRVDRLDRMVRDKAYNDAAAISIKNSKFSPEIYRCSPVTTDYYFDVDFSPNGEKRNQDFRPATGGMMGPGGHI